MADEECQLDIYYALLRMRGDGIDPFAGVPPIRTLTVEEYEAELKRRAPKPKLSERPEAERPVNPWDVGMQLLGFIQPKKPSTQQAVTDKVDHVAAFYSSASRTVTVIDRGAERNDLADSALLLHELVHSIQDDEVDRWDGGSTDANFAVNAMIEGEAVMYEELARFELEGIEATDEAWDRKFDRALDGKRKRMVGAIPWYATEWFVYPLGGELLTDTYRRGGTAAVRHLLGSAPRHAVELMRNHDRVEGATPGSLACNPRAPGERFRLADSDRVGAVNLYGFLVHAGLDEPEAWDLALQMRDDQLFIFFDSEAEDVAVAWRVRLGKKKQAERLAEALSRSPDYRVDAIDTDIVVRAANRDGLLEVWPATSSCP